jgi:hypothetical protein
MKFTFKNLGVLDEATLELTDLTLICGENNTGKTYATYAVYGFFVSWREILREILAREILSAANSTNRFNLTTLFEGKINDYFVEIAKKYIAYLPAVFATEKSAFSKTEISISIGAELSFNDTYFHTELYRDIEGQGLTSILVKEENSTELVLWLAKGANLLNWPIMVADAMVKIVFAPYFPNAHICSAERTGISIFRTDLDLAWSRAVNTPNTPFKPNRPWPLTHNLDFIRSVEDIDKLTSDLAKNHPDILTAFESIIGGAYKVIKDQGLFYQPEGRGKPKFTMGESSSSVRALLDMGIYLRCIASPGDLLIIDEPELNLHPKNQRALARLVVRLVNAGLKVFITTHSDYFVKEFNTLIMLAQKTDHTIKVQQTHGYADQELLNPEKVCLYMAGAHPIGKRKAKINTLIAAKIHPDLGIDATTFDTTIEEMNAIQSDILYGGEL